MISTNLQLTAIATSKLAPTTTKTTTKAVKTTTTRAPTKTTTKAVKTTTTRAPTKTTTKAVTTTTTRTNIITSLPTAASVDWRTSGKVNAIEFEIENLYHFIQIKHINIFFVFQSKKSGRLWQLLGI